MVISEVTLAAIKHAYQIWNDSRGENVEAIMGLMADDVQLTTLADGASPLGFSKPCSNREEVSRYLDGLIGDWDLLSAKIEEIVCERNCVVVLLETCWRNRRTDKHFESPAAHAWRFRNGKATHVRLFFDTARWCEAAHGGGDAPLR